MSSRWKRNKIPVLPPCPPPIIRFTAGRRRGNGSTSGRPPPTRGVLRADRAAVPQPLCPGSPLTFQEADPGPGLRQAGEQGVEDDLGCAVLLQLLPVARVLVQHHHGRQAGGPRRPLGARQQPGSGRRVGHHEVQRHGPAAGPPHHHRVEVDVERAAEAGGRVGQVGPAVQHQAAGGLLPQQLPQLAAVEGRDFHAGRGSRPAAAGAGAEKAAGGCPALARSRRRWDGREGRRHRGAAPSPGRESRPAPPGIYMNGRPGRDDAAHIRGVTRPPPKHGHPPPRAPPLAGIPSLPSGGRSASEAEEAEKRCKNSPLIGWGSSRHHPRPLPRASGD